jgi:hypothetical protein
LPHHGSGQLQGKTTIDRRQTLPMCTENFTRID